MMSAETIRCQNRQQAVKAANEGVLPLILEEEDLGEPLNEVARRIPVIGSLKPKGWEEVESYFVDSSGIGQANEPALTFPHFLHKVRDAGPGYGWAITSTGQFQVHITQFRRVK